jgi:rod shape-determining protein MreD
LSVLRALVFLLAALALQVGLGGLWPSIHRLVDALSIPVVLYGVGGSQRMAMGVGCAAGLLQDAWFRVESFGAGGIRWTLIGWVLGGASERVDLNHATGRLIAGSAFSLADQLLDALMRRLVGRPSLLPGALSLILGAAATGLLAMLVGSILDRARETRFGRLWA